MSRLLEKNVCSIRFLEDNGMSALISLPAQESAEARPRSPAQTTSPTAPALRLAQAQTLCCSLPLLEEEAKGPRQQQSPHNCLSASSRGTGSSASGHSPTVFLDGSPSWHSSIYGHGPSWDQTHWLMTTWCSHLAGGFR